LHRIIDKVPLERLRDKQLRVSLLCPRCESAPMSLGFENSMNTWRTIACPKCGVEVMLDSMSLVLLTQNATTTVGETPAARSHAE